MSNIKIYPVQFEVYSSDDETCKLGEFKGFDTETINVELNAILSPDELRELANKLEVAIKLFKEGLI
jgi:hypothetical protein